MLACASSRRCEECRDGDAGGPEGGGGDGAAPQGAGTRRGALGRGGAPGDPGGGAAAEADGLGSVPRSARRWAVPDRRGSREHQPRHGRAGRADVVSGMTGFLLDTNIVSEMRRPNPDPAVVAWLDKADARTLFLSAISVAEITAGIGAMPAGARRDAIER